MKIFIEDLVAKHKGEKETELPEDTTIRFEYSDKHGHISISVRGGELRIYKKASPANITIQPVSSNIIYIK